MGTGASVQRPGPVVEVAADQDRVGSIVGQHVLELVPLTPALPPGEAEVGVQHGDRPVARIQTRMARFSKKDSLMLMFTPRAIGRFENVALP